MSDPMHFSDSTDPAAPGLRFQVVAFDGMDELDAVAPYEVLRLMASATGAEVELVRVEAARSHIVTAAHGLRLDVPGVLDPAQPPTVLLVPGGGWVDLRPDGARAECARGVLPGLLARLHGGGTVLAAVCTGAMILARAGLLKDRPAATHHGARADLAATGARVVEARVVDDGDIVTAGGVTSGLDLALHLIDRFAGAEQAARVAEILEYEPRGPVMRPPQA